MTNTVLTRSPKRQVEQRNIALYPSDIEDVEAIRRLYGLDSFSQAVRKAVRLAMERIADKPRNEVN